MNTTFDDRKNAFENKFALDQQLQFRAEAKTCKMMGAWAATEMGLQGEAVTHYANDLVVANLDEPGMDDVVDRIETDFKAKGISKSWNDIKARLDQCYAQAKEQLMTEAS